MNEQKCPCEPVEALIRLVDEHEKTIKRHEERLDDHDERLNKGNIQFAVISTKLNIIMAVLAAIGVAVCGAIVSNVL